MKVTSTLLIKPLHSPSTISFGADVVLRPKGVGIFERVLQLTQPDVREGQKLLKRFWLNPYQPFNEGDVTIVDAKQRIRTLRNLSSHPALANWKRRLYQAHSGYGEFHEQDVIYRTR